MNLTSILCALLMVFVLNRGVEGSEPDFYRTRGYKVQPIPLEWSRANGSGTIPDVRDVAVDFRWPAGRAFGDFSIKGFIARYGMPDQYWVRERGKGDWDYLVYDRSEGILLVYVPKPPGAKFGAVAIWDRKGRLLDLIK